MKLFSLKNNKQKKLNINETQEKDLVLSKKYNDDNDDNFFKCERLNAKYNLIDENGKILEENLSPKDTLDKFFQHGKIVDWEISVFPKSGFAYLEKEYIFWEAELLASTATEEDITNPFFKSVKCKLYVKNKECFLSFKSEKGDFKSVVNIAYQEMLKKLENHNWKGFPKIQKVEVNHA